jgi:predicted RNase H-like nuclease (RuvC/YqgF family)
MTDQAWTALSMIAVAVCTYCIPKIIEARREAREKRHQGNTQVDLALIEDSKAFRVQLLETINSLRAQNANQEARLQSLEKELTKSKAEAVVLEQDRNQWKYTAKVTKAASDLEIQKLRNEVAELQKAVRVLTNANEDLSEKVASLERHMREAGIEPPVVMTIPIAPVKPVRPPVPPPPKTK